MNEITCNYVPVDSIPKLLEEKIYGLVESCFSDKEKTPEEKKEHNDKFCSAGDRTGFALATLDSEVIGAAIAYKRVIKYKGKDITLGGIGGVCTKENFRRRGIATRLNKMVMEKLKDADCDVAYLCTDTNKLGKLYGFAGFQKLKEKYTYLGRSGKRYYDGGGMIAPIASSEIFQKIVNSNESFDLGVGDW